MCTPLVKVPKLAMGGKKCLKEQVLGPSTYLLVGFTLNLTYGALTQA